MIPTSRVPELGMLGSVGAPGGQPPGATRRRGTEQRSARRGCRPRMSRGFPRQHGRPRRAPPDRHGGITASLIPCPSPPSAVAASPPSTSSPPRAYPPLRPGDGFDSRCSFGAPRSRRRHRDVRPALDALPTAANRRAGGGDIAVIGTSTPGPREIRQDATSGELVRISSARPGGGGLPQVTLLHLDREEHR